MKSSKADISGSIEEICGAAVDISTIVRHPGRNTATSGKLSDGRSFFAKRLEGPGGDVRFARSLVAAHLMADLATPQLIGSDPASNILVFERLDDQEIQYTQIEDAPDRDWLIEALRIAAQVHSIDRSEEELIPFASPNPSVAVRISAEAYSAATASELDVYQILHRDPLLYQELQALREDESTSSEAHVLIHGDLRVDQFVSTKAGLYIVDLEESRRGDPARDLGSLLGDYLHRMLVNLPSKELRSRHALAEEITDNDILEAGVRALERESIAIRDGLSVYAETRRDFEPSHDFVSRAIRFSGWHMYDRAFAVAQTSSTVPAPYLAAAGIGRGLLASPGLLVGELVGS